MIIRAPNDPILKSSAEGDPERFIRDIACIPRTGLKAFIRRPKKMYNCVKDYPNPFNPETYKFIEGYKCKDNLRRYLHIDLAKNRDAIGIAMAHVPNFIDREVIEENSKRKIKVKAPIVRLDFWGRITVSSKEEYVLGDIREIVYDLSRMGFYIGLITLDRFQSLDSIQILKSYGYIAANMSIDKTAYYIRLSDVGESNKDGYNRVSTNGCHNYAVTTLKELAYDDRLEAPNSSRWYKEDFFVQECIRSQEGKKGKVDHLPNYHNDVMQAAAGCITNAVSNEIFIMNNESEKDLEKMKDEYYSQIKSLDNNLIKQESYLDYNTDDPRDIGTERYQL
jgi:hypothetical protein